MNAKSVAQFVKELTALTRKHKIVLTSCGCCNSICIEPLEKTDSQNGYVYDVYDEKVCDNDSPFFENMNWDEVSNDPEE